MYKLLFLASVLFASMSQAQTIEGYPRVIDGDTLDIQGQRIRIANIDAPESKQTCSLNGSAYYCGKTSTQFLRSFIGGSKATCKVISKDRYKRFISTCYVRETDIGAVMVAEGHAVAYLRYSRAYKPLQDAAEREQRGIWSTEFMMPEKWRRQN